jgi:hypothetical protein
MLEERFENSRDLFLFQINNDPVGRHAKANLLQKTELTRQRESTIVNKASQTESELIELCGIYAQTPFFTFIAKREMPCWEYDMDYNFSIR